MAVYTAAEAYLTLLFLCGLERREKLLSNLYVEEKRVCFFLL